MSRKTKERILNALENKNEIIVNDVEEGDTIRHYYLDLEVNGKQTSVSIEETERKNPEIIEITNIQVEGSEIKLSDKLKKEIEDYLIDNPESWRGN